MAASNIVSHVLWFLWLRPQRDRILSSTTKSNNNKSCLEFQFSWCKLFFQLIKIYAKTIDKKFISKTTLTDLNKVLEM